jgi:hypothetical protein
VILNKKTSLLHQTSEQRQQKNIGVLYHVSASARCLFLLFSPPSLVVRVLTIDLVTAAVAVAVAVSYSCLWMARNQWRTAVLKKKKKQSKLKTAKQGTEGSGLVNYLVLLSISLSRWAKEGVQTDKQQKDLIQQ